jgi:hypothetical protein
MQVPSLRFRAHSTCATEVAFSLDVAPTTGSPVESEANSPADWAAGARRANRASSSTAAPKLREKTRGIGRNDLGHRKRGGFLCLGREALPVIGGSDAQVLHKDSPQRSRIAQAGARGDVFERQGGLRK